VTVRRSHWQGSVRSFNSVKYWRRFESASGKLPRSGVRGQGAGVSREGGDRSTSLRADTERRRERRKAQGNNRVGPPDWEARSRLREANLHPSVCHFAISFFDFFTKPGLMATHLGPRRFCLTGRLLSDLCSCRRTGMHSEMPTAVTQVIAEPEPERT
jgi:hypothetical protein